MPLHSTHWTFKTFLIWKFHEKEYVYPTGLSTSQSSTWGKGWVSVEKVMKAYYLLILLFFLIKSVPEKAHSWHEPMRPRSDDEPPKPSAPIQHLNCFSALWDVLSAILFSKWPREKSHLPARVVLFRTAKNWREETELVLEKWLWRREREKKKKGERTNTR